MIYVSRDDQGAINGTFANLQPGYAEELLADDHPDLIAYRQAKADAIAARESVEARDAEQRATVKADAFVAQFVAMTPAEVETYINNNTANLAAVRALLVRMGKMLLLLARREFR